MNLCAAGLLQKPVLAASDHNPTVYKRGFMKNSDRYWSVSAALVWIATRDQNLCEDIDPNSGYMDVATFLGRVKSQEVHSVMRLCYALEKALTAGRVSALAIKNGRGERSPIECHEWIGLNLKDAIRRSGFIASPAHQSSDLNLTLSEILIPISEIKREWPARGKKMPKRSAPRYPWGDFENEVLRNLEDSGIPYPTLDPNWTKAKLESLMAHWCSKHWEKLPSHSTLNTRINQAIETFRIRRSAQVSNVEVTTHTDLIDLID
jgi:hypothetical protein